MLRPLFVSIILAFGGPVFAQQEANTWYFGNQSGFDFNSGSPVVITGAINTPEGCSSISDHNGDLLFYTDGVTIWNRNHVPMPNGTGLLGLASSTQNSIIIPQPGSTSIYYVFTADGLSSAFNHHMDNGYRYSIVNMSLDGGFGDVTAVKNVLLYAPSTEKLAAVRHADGMSVWLMTHEWNSTRFAAYKIDCNGLNTTPVYSDLGERHEMVNGGATMLYLDAIGQMKFSPDGKRLALVILGKLRPQVFDFDAATGIVSNPISLLSYYIDGFLQPDGGVFDFENMYGVEFSPNGKLLYLTRIDYGNLYQYDLSPGTSVGISATGIVYDMGPWCTPISGGGFSCPGVTGGLQLAPNGKIYMAYKYFTGLNVIANPDVYGPGCNYQQSPPLTYASEYGLPSFMASYFYTQPQDSLQLIADSCGTVSANYSGTPSGTLTWIFDDPTSPSNVVTGNNASHTYTLPGQYTVTLTLSTAGGCNKTLYKTIDIDTCMEPPIQFPNVFSPNGDGANDVFDIHGLEKYPDNEVVIYNRWGNEVFRQPGYNDNNGFTGAGCTDGVYYYQVTVPSINLRHHGTVTIVR